MRRAYGILLSILLISVTSLGFNQSFATNLHVYPEFLSIKIPKQVLKSCQEYLASTIRITNVGPDSISNITIQPSGEWNDAMNVRITPNVISLGKDRPEKHPTAEIRILIKPTGKTLEGTYNGNIIIQGTGTSSVSVFVSVPHTPLKDVNACAEGHLEPSKQPTIFTLDLKFDTKYRTHEVKAGDPFNAVLEITNTGKVPLKNVVAKITLDQGLSTVNSKIKYPQLVKPDGHAFLKWKINTQKVSSDYTAKITVKVDTLEGSKSITKEIKIRH